MKNYMNDIKEIRSYLLLWFTQMISGLGSAMTAYAWVTFRFLGIFFIKPAFLRVIFPALALGNRN